MTNQEIINFIHDNTEAKLLQFVDTIIEKANKIDKDTNILSLIMLILFFLYYLSNFKITSSLQLGPLTINDISIIKAFIPLIMSFILLKFVIIRAHQAELKRVLRFFSKEFYKFDLTRVAEHHTDDITRILLPFSMYDEINKINDKTKVGCLSTIFFLPLLALALAPYFLVYLCISPQIQIFHTIGFIEKFIVGSTIWICLFSLFYFAKNIQIALKENK